MALAMDLSSRGPALPKGCWPGDTDAEWHLAVVPGLLSHGGTAWLERGLPLWDGVGQGSSCY